MKRIFLFVLFFYSGMSIAQNPLVIPTTITSTNINLNLQEGVTQFYPGINTNTMGANGDLLGPTLILNQGDFVNITVDNMLMDTTTIHWHGLHIAPENDGGPHSTIAPMESWNPAFTVMDKAGIYWYHPHLHMMTNMHVSMGIAGMIIVKDTEEAALTLPRDYGVDDFPIIIQTKGFDAAGQITWMTELDTALMVNGTIDPFLNVPSQVVRLRVLNGSSQRVYKLGLSNNMTFDVIGTDGGLLAAPVNLTRYQIAPGQRVDILVDLTGMQGQSVQLMGYGSELANAIYGATQPGMMAGQTLPGYASNPLNGNDFQILDLVIGAQTALPVTTIPATLAVHVPMLEGTEDATKALTFTTNQNIVGPFLINGAPFEMDVINETVQLGDREIWTLTNQTPISHPFHIHDVQFKILDINGAQPPMELRGWNDVVLVPAGMGTVRFIADFLDFASDTMPYMYHCHMLTHEDGGMMGQFLVVDPQSAVSEYELTGVSVYPNPSSDGNVTIKRGNYVGVLNVLDAQGRLIQKIESHLVEMQLLMRPGYYFIATSEGESIPLVIN